MTDIKESTRKEVLDQVVRYYASAFPPTTFVPGETPVPVAGKVFGAEEMCALVEASLDFQLTEGRFVAKFEREFAKFFGVREARLVNSGSSANLVAISALTSPTLKDRRLMPGDEVITLAAGFPTTVNPVVQNRAVPVFIDVELPTYGPRLADLEAALSPRTRAVIFAHTLGNPFDVETVSRFCKQHGLWLIEDCCDAVGSTFQGRPVGSFGDFATVSFYPAHHITMGEGGCVLSDQPALMRLAESFRDWGRDCWCDPGRSDTCGKRFSWHLGELPAGYDHKYIYSHVGYNLKVTDMQAAVGVAQMERLPGFIAARKKNFAALKEGFKDLEDVLVLPEATPGADPSWFGFPVSVRPTSGLRRADLVSFLEAKKIATRQLFAGNLVRQPAYLGVLHRQVGDLKGSDFVMQNTFWIGVYPALTKPMVEFMIECMQEGAKKLTAARTLRVVMP